MIKKDNRFNKLNIVLSTVMLSLLLASIVLLMLVLSATLLADNPLLTKRGSCFSLLDSWRTEDGTALSPMKLQTALFVPSQPDGQAVISCKLPQDIPAGFSLYFRSDCRGAAVYCDGELAAKLENAQPSPLQPDMFRMYAVPHRYGLLPVSSRRKESGGRILRQIFAGIRLGGAICIPSGRNPAGASVSRGKDRDWYIDTKGDCYDICFF